VLWRNCGELVGKLGGSFTEHRKQAQKELTHMYTEAGSLALQMQAPYAEGALPLPAWAQCRRNHSPGRCTCGWCCVLEGCQRPGPEGCKRPARAAVASLT
jgi:hypothetical protein